MENIPLLRNQVSVWFLLPKSSQKVNFTARRFEHSQACGVWALSASLVDQIKSLFLPCDLLVVEDISLELSHGVTIALKSKLLCLRIWLIVIAKSFMII